MSPCWGWSTVGGRRRGALSLVYVCGDLQLGAREGAQGGAGGDRTGTGRWEINLQPQVSIPADQRRG